MSYIVNKKNEEAVIAVESRDHAKNNGIIPKDLMSRINNLKFVKRWNGALLGVCAGLLLFIAGGIFHACIKKAECKWKVASTEQITFDLMDKTIAYEFNIRIYEENGKFIEDASQKANENVFQYFKNYCVSKGLVFDNKTMAFVLYYDLHISQSLSITDEHIKGISVYKIEGDNIMHHLYMRNADFDFYEVENVKVPVPFASVNQAFFYLENYVFTDVQNVSSITLMGDFAVETYKNIRKYETTPIQYEINVVNLPGGGGCSYCGSYVDNSCVRGSDGSLVCGGLPDPPPCPGDEMYMLNVDTWKNVYDRPLMHSFRDNILSNSEKGNSYIDNYYFLGKEWKGKFTIALVTKTAVVLVNFTPVMHAFLEPDTHMDEVMFTPALSTPILNLLDEYQTITTSAEGKDILNSIRADIDVLRNKTLGEILVMLD
jgi:hypothetical protein